MRRHFIYGGIGVLVIASTVLIGCNREATEPGTLIGERSTARDDESLQTYVQSRFYADDSIRGNDIDVSVANGTVTLTGTVDSEEARQHVLETARQVDGVTEINDQLRIAAAPDAAAASNRPVEGGTERAEAGERSPTWITTKIQSQYFLNPEIKGWNIDVDTSEDGVVTLRGEVDEATHRDEAERIAESTEGVTRVINQLRVRSETPTADAGTPAGTPDADRPGMEQPDAWLTAKIQSQYFVDDEVKGFNIDVDTRDGVVTLRGVTDNQAARERAVTLARNTEGVVSVNDQLRVQPEADKMERSAEPETTPPADRPGAAQRSRDTASAINDAWITTKIQSQFFLNSDVKTRTINVETEAGVVTLTGTVASDAEKQAAGTIAQNTEGVTKVNNQLQVQTPPQN